MMTVEQLLEFSKATLKDETSTDERKAAAKKAIRRVENRAERIKGLPKRPKRKDFASDAEHEQALKEFRFILDRAAVVREASKILDDPQTSVFLRKKARQTLYGLDPAEPEPAGPVKSQDTEKPPRSRLSTTELADERALAQNFLDSIGQPDTHPVPAPSAQQQQHFPPKPTSKPDRWCHVHAVSLDACRCDANETCPLCLNPRSRCYFPCQNARPRR